MQMPHNVDRRMKRAGRGVHITTIGAGCAAERALDIFPHMERRSMLKVVQGDARPVRLSSSTSWEAGKNGIETAANSLVGHHIPGGAIPSSLLLTPSSKRQI